MCAAHCFLVVELGQNEREQPLPLPQACYRDCRADEQQQRRLPACDEQQNRS